MSYENFKQTFWSKEIQHELEKRAILSEWCNTQFTGEAKYGGVVRIIGAARPTISDYTGESITRETVGDSSVDLVIDQRKYFNFEVDDVDRAQSVPGLMESLIHESAIAMNIAVDSVIAAKAVDAGYISASTQINTAAGAKSAVDAAILALRENDVAIDSEVVMELPPFVYQLLKDKYIELDTANSDMLAKGIVGYYDNVRVRICNNLYSDGTDCYAMIRTNKAIAFASQIDSIEAYRPQDGFKDAIKGLNVFGAKVVRPKEIAVIRAHK